MPSIMIISFCVAGIIGLQKIKVVPNLVWITQNKKCVVVFWIFLKSHSLDSMNREKNQVWDCYQGYREQPPVTF